jgi:hypothetical protein
MLQTHKVLKPLELVSFFDHANKVILFNIFKNPCYTQGMILMNKHWRA